MLPDREASGRPAPPPAPPRHPYLTLLLVGPVCLSTLLAVGLLLSGAWSTLLASPLRLFLVVLGILLPVAAAVVFHRGRRRTHPPSP